MRFTVGDRVVLVSEFADIRTGGNRAIPRGSVGTVAKNSSDVRIGVSWDGFYDGHDCDGRLNGDLRNSGWFVDASELELLVDSPQEDYSVDIGMLL